MLFLQNGADAQKVQNIKTICSFFMIGEGLGFLPAKLRGAFVGVVKKISAFSTPSSHEGFRKMCFRIK